MQNFPSHIEQAIQYLKEQLGEHGTVVLFGSRARQTTRKNADYDIGVFTQAGYDWKTFAVWKTQAEELAWPYKIDVVDLSRAPREFLEVIMSEMVVLHGSWNGRTLTATEA